MVDAGRVIAIFGPTGVGKTSVAVEVAERLGVSVISCDSMQLYQGFPVLTNQPRLQETRGVEHELVAVADPQEEWTAVEYGRRAQEAIDRSRAETGWALLVGGTGLYMRAALAPLSASRAHDQGLRAELTRRGEESGVDHLYRELKALDPAAAGAVDGKNLRRVVRALEVVTLEGPGSWDPEGDLWDPDYRHPTLLIGLTREREELYARIDERAGRMLDAGALDEVRMVSEKAGGVPMAGAVAKAIGFRELKGFLEGELSRAEAVERLALRVRAHPPRSPSAPGNQWLLQPRRPSGPHRPSPKPSAPHPRHRHPASDPPFHQYGRRAPPAPG